jgi:hypothetical protein
MASPRLIALLFFLVVSVAGGPSFAEGTDQERFLAGGAAKLSPKQLKELFSGSEFISRELTVRNFADGNRVFKARGFSVQLKWWIDGRSRFCTDTRLGGEHCEVEYFLDGNKLKIFNRDGATAQEFTVNK